MTPNQPEDPTVAPHSGTISLSHNRTISPLRAFVVASSPRSLKPDLHRPQPGDLVIAADGGANLCDAWGWAVDAVVGDMDSLDPLVAAKLQAVGVPFHSYPVEKDETDLEIALHQALDLGANEILIAGALGARIDHTLGNLALLALPALADVRAFIVDGGQSIWLVRDRLAIEGQPGDTLSLLPFGGDARGVTVTGVHWPLDEADLLLGPSLGISNLLTASKVEVSMRAGALLAIHIHAGANLSNSCSGETRSLVRLILASKPQVSTEHSFRIKEQSRVPDRLNRLAVWP